MLFVISFPKDNLFNIFMSDHKWRLKVSLFVCFFSSLFNEFHIMGPLFHIYHISYLSLTVTI